MKSEKITKAKILIIDEDVNMMEILTEILNRYGHTVDTYTEPVSAIEELKNNKYDILLVNYLMTPVTGDRVVELVREFDKEIYIILMSMHRDLAPSIESMQNLDIQAYFEKSSRFDQLIIFIQTGIKYIEQINKVTNMNMKLDHYIFDFAKILLNTVAAKDHYTEEHSKRVTDICREFAKYSRLDRTSTENLITAASFHDIGKIGIPDNILLKEGKLTDDEYNTIKLHPIIGANIFSVSNIFSNIVSIIKHHHERYDGKGYPDKLKETEIPYLARILTVCDCFDAIVSKRPYKDENTIEYAIKEIKKCSGSQFDPKIAKEFVEFLNDKTKTVKEIITQQEEQEEEEEDSMY